MKALVLEDQQMFSDLLCSLLRERLKFKEVEAVGTCAEARSLFAPDRYELAVLDFDLPDGNGLDLARDFTEADPRLRVVTVSGQIDEFTLSRVIDSGAMAFVDKVNDGLKHLEQAMIEVMDWRMYFSRSIHDSQMSLRRDPKAYNKLLTDKEIELMYLFGLGLSNDEIATRLQAGKTTIEGHRKSVMRKLGLKSSLGLMRYALSKGFTRVSDIHRQLGED